KLVIDDSHDPLRCERVDGPLLSAVTLLPVPFDDLALPVRYPYQLVRIKLYESLPHLLHIEQFKPLDCCVLPALADEPFDQVKIYEGVPGFPEFDKAVLSPALRDYLVDDFASGHGFLLRTSLLRKRLHSGLHFTT